MSLNIDEVLGLKKYLENKNAVKMHLHDACGGQYFTLEKPDKATMDLIKLYLKEKKIMAVFSNDNSSFTIGGLHCG